MKKIIVLCMVLMLFSGLGFSQSQPPGFSNTIGTGFGNSTFLGDNLKDNFKFYGIVNYFTANFDVGKLNLTGDIHWQMGIDDGFTIALDANFNAIMRLFDWMHLGLGTNLEWAVGPAPTKGPLYSAYSVPYYAGIYFSDDVLESEQTYGVSGGGPVDNYYGDRSLAVRFVYEDMFEAGVALSGTDEDDWTLGLGVKVNIADVVSIGASYTGDFQRSPNNNLYIGSSITAIKDVPIDIWLNFVPNQSKTNKDGNNTFGGRVGIPIGGFRLVPEFSVTIYNKEDTGVSMYAAIDAYFSITNTMILGLNTGFGMGSNPNTEIDDYRSGGRLNVNPYFVWNLNETNKLSIGAHIMPVWHTGTSETSEFYWGIPIAWRMSF